VHHTSLGLLCAALLLAGCATPQTQAVLRQQGDLPRQMELAGVPYHPQDANQCGPATLAMAMGAHGTTVAPEILAQQVYLPEKAGSLQVEMLSATRRHGFVAYLIDPTLTALLGEIAAGRPVIVLENLAFNWYPQWHYAVAIGYDLDRGTIVLRSGAEQRQVLPLTTFEHLWARSGYWGLLALPPDQLPAHANETRYVAAAVALETTAQQKMGPTSRAQSRRTGGLALLRHQPCSTTPCECAPRTRPIARRASGGRRACRR
jgi:hypothetical protein